MVTFYDYYIDRHGVEPDLCDRDLKEAYTAGQESMRPLVEKMREALEIMSEWDTDGKICGEYGCNAPIISREALAEADKFLGKGGV